MTEEHDHESPAECPPTADDFFDFGCDIMRHLCGEQFDYRLIPKILPLMIDLAAGKSTITESPAEFRAWRNSYVESRIKHGQPTEDLGPLMDHNPDEDARRKIRHHQQLARLVLKSQYGKEAD